MRVSSERLFGRQIRFAIRTLRKQPSRGDRRLFGNQLRFAYRTLRDAIRQEREAGVPGAQEMREAVPASQEERGGVSSGLATFRRVSYAGVALPEETPNGAPENRTVALATALTRLVMQVTLSLAMVTAGLVVLLGGSASADLQKWAAGWIGAVIGYWLH
jgi:hypothetical protein